MLPCADAGDLPRRWQRSALLLDKPCATKRCRTAGPLLHLRLRDGLLPRRHEPPQAPGALPPGARPTAAASLRLLPSKNKDYSAATPGEENEENDKYHTAARRRQYARATRPRPPRLAAAPSTRLPGPSCALMRAAFRRRPAAAWEGAFDAAKVPGAACRTHEVGDLAARVDSGLVVVNDDDDENDDDDDDDEKKEQNRRQRRRPGPIAWCRTYTAAPSSPPPSSPSLCAEDLLTLRCLRLNP